MNASSINPFNELYVTETVAPRDFVTLFSPTLIKDALPLFLPGNVVVKGVQGSGKSMLLTLLKPEIRVAYAKAGCPLPLPQKISRFIGAGINFIRSAAIDFGQRSTDANMATDLQRLPLYFADFFNYWVVYDLFNSIEMLSRECDGTIAAELQISADENTLNDFATELAVDPCWSGYLGEIHSYEQLKGAIIGRLSTYRRFLNFAVDQLPEVMRRSITPVGEPIARTVESLRLHGVIPDDLPIFVRIDQYEELCKLEDWSGELGLQYRRVINKALGLRDPRVSYRIGARRYAWHEDLQLYGASSILELERDYKVVDIDEILRRKENRRTWTFPDFAEDVLERRLRYADYDTVKSNLRTILQDNAPSADQAARYAASSLDKVVVIDETWSEGLVNYVKSLAFEDPLAAKLCEAWLRQRHLTILKKPFPWHSRGYWRKERIKQALMQVAARAHQRMIWAGKDEVIALSGGNVLVFVSLCQHIWSAWSRSIRGLEQDNERTTLPRIDVNVQAVGIQSASTHWYNKITEQLGKSHERQRFVNRLGRLFREEMLNDRAMSYPGHNGFSLREEDLESDPWLSRFLNEAVDYGDLFDAPHTTKSKDRKPRKKWYLNPILSPHFQIPETHVKEPMYVSPADVRQWLLQAGVDVPNSKQKRFGAPDPGQMALSFGSRHRK
jgi:hypothetical protein